MTNTPLLLTGILVLAVGTFSLRFAGPLLRSRLEIPERAQQFVAAAAIATGRMSLAQRLVLWARRTGSCSTRSPGWGVALPVRFPPAGMSGRSLREGGIGVTAVPVSARYQCR